MKGYKTVIAGLFVALVPPGLEYFASIDWTQYVSPQIAPVIVGCLFVVLRAVTNTPLGGKGKY